MSAEPFAAGWCRVRIRDGIGIMWVQPFPCAAPNPWVIAGRTRLACSSMATASFIARLDEFERDMIVERIAAGELL